MSWVTDFTKFGHSIFVTFIELKIEGSWTRVVESRPELAFATHFEAIKADSAEGCIVHFIEPDGLRRMLQFTLGGTLAIHQNVLSYHPAQVSEIIVDEKAQSGKGKTRDTLS